jgi:hypothetical protein
MTSVTSCCAQRLNYFYPPLLQGRVYANFKQEENYLVTLFDLVLRLYHIPFDDPMVRDLREQLLKEASPLTSRR